ncbi:activator of stress genes 1 [Cladorrhinum samala]|uniref:Activator of stress genes 1 n=1 Tax=Cladorrhinum samala TaxID=585594 RepID=A0AAV9HVE0_9PEZI|nr:activator of stress genes 1 [Cladorrhinum samala]
MDSPKHIFVSETGQPASRRRKVRLACTLCRARKTGCDGRKPVCTACSLRGWDDKCGYQDSVIQSSAALTLVDLDRRLQRLESESFGESETSRKSTPAQFDNLGFGQGDSSRSAVSETTFEENDDAASMLESNAAFMRRGLEAAGPSDSYDTSANAILSGESLFTNIFPAISGASSNNIDRSLGELGLQDVAFPQPQMAQDRISWYWHHVHSVFPFLHRPTFERRYQSFSQTGLSPQESHLGFDEAVFHATLNMVLAMGSQRNGTIPPAERQYQAEEFYRRSLRLVSVEALDTMSLSIVQLLLLRALYLYFSGRADRCWVMAGAAIRVATGMGLQTVPRRPMSQLEREMRRRVWHCGCVGVDLILSSTFGRGPLISRAVSQPPLPLAIDDEYLSATEEGSQPDGVPSRMDLAIYSTNIIAIMEAMHSPERTPRLKLAHGGIEHSVPDPSAILRLNSMIDDFLDGLPAHLRPGADYSRMMIRQEDYSYFAMQGQVIRFRLLFLRLLLLRPSVLAEARRWTAREPGAAQTASSMLQERLHLEACSLCLETVHAVLEKTHSALGTQHQIPEWYALHFSFSSATILLVAMLSPKLGVSLELEPTKSSWDRAMGILDFHKTHIPSAAKGLEVLHRYRQTIMNRLNSRLGSPQEPSSSSASISAASISSLPGASQGQQAQTSSWAAPEDQDVGTGMMMQGLDEFLVSESLDDAWLGMQDYGEGDWMLQF